MRARVVGPDWTQATRAKGLQLTTWTWMNQMARLLDHLMPLPGLPASPCMQGSMGARALMVGAFMYMHLLET